MKRSEINGAIDRAVAFFRQMRLPLPPFAYWTAEQWKAKGQDCEEIRAVRLGWDVTDFGSGDFPNTGRTIFTLRNGLVGHPTYAKPYAQKAMCLAEGQRSPVHYHRSKTEDIINGGGGNVCITLWRATADDELSGEPFDVSLDGVRQRVATGETLTLRPGQSVCVTPRTYHQFWSEAGPGTTLGIEVSSVCDDVGETLTLRPGQSVCVTPRTYHQFWSEAGPGTTLGIEVSSVCDDVTDNFFLEGGDRFPRIEEDEARRYLLCSEYPPAR